VLKSVPPQQVLGVREVLPTYDGISRLHDELVAYLLAHQIQWEEIYPATTIYYDNEYQDRGVDVEAAARLAQPLPGTSRIRMHQLPGAETMACTLHQGPYDQLNNGYRYLLGWVEANGYRVSGPNRDIYLKGPGPELDPAEYLTELQFPIEKKPVSIYVNQVKEKTEMEPKIESRPAFTVVGMQYHGKNENNEIPQIWQAFNPRMGEIKHIGNNRECFGVCAELEEDGETFKYLACWEVSSPTDIPEGMVSWEIPAQTYAVFPCTLPTIHEAYEHAHQTWLPQSGYKRAAGPDFELYDMSFNPQIPDSVLYIYIPIEK
jgi:predicted transcriptional regulator YdeE